MTFFTGNIRFIQINGNFSWGWQLISQKRSKIHFPFCAIVKLAALKKSKNAPDVCNIPEKPVTENKFPGCENFASCGISHMIFGRRLAIPFLFFRRIFYGSTLRLLAIFPEPLYNMQILLIPHRKGTYRKLCFQI